MNLRDLPLILAAAVLLGAGAWRVAISHDTEWTGAAFLAAGMILIGVWVARGGDDDRR